MAGAVKMAGQTKTRESVLREIKRRARAGGVFGLRSAANRSDWLCAAAVTHFGSWETALALAGLKYYRTASRPCDAKEAKQWIRAMAASGTRVLAFNDKRLHAAAVRIFGSWKAARAAAGLPEHDLVWPATRVVATIRERELKGLPLNTMAVLDDDRFLYRAARLRFGSWTAAFRAALGREPDKKHSGRRRSKKSTGKRSR